MANSGEWRSSLTAMERYGNIEKIGRAFAHSHANQKAFAFEQEAYERCSSREEYEAACTMDRTPSPPQSLRTDSHGSPSHSILDEGDDEEPGVRVGPYQSCHYVASGVTAEVYRSKDRALKVITETRNIEPHNPLREAKILALLKKPCIPLLEAFRDQEQRFVLVFPYMPSSLSDLLGQGPLSESQTRSIFIDVLSALVDMHRQGMIHRDIKPSAVLMASPTGPAYLSDFGTAWHPSLSASSEPADSKILDIGTGPYRSPDVLFGNKSYGAGVDIWGVGTMLAECCRSPPKPLFDSGGAHEDGNQLGLILSIFKTLGSPTRESWPEAATFKTPPFDMYRSFESRTWEEILPDVKPQWRHLVASMITYNSSRATAEQVLLRLENTL